MADITLDLPEDVLAPGASCTIDMCLNPCTIRSLHWAPGLAIAKLSAGGQTFGEEEISEDKFVGVELPEGPNAELRTVRITFRNDGEEPAATSARLVVAPKYVVPIAVRQAAALNQGAIMGQSVQPHNFAKMPRSGEEYVTVRLRRKHAKVILRLCERGNDMELAPCQHPLRKALQAST